MCGWWRCGGTSIRTISTPVGLRLLRWPTGTSAAWKSSERNIAARASSGSWRRLPMTFLNITHFLQRMSNGERCKYVVIQEMQLIKVIVNVVEFAIIQSLFLSIDPWVWDQLLHWQHGPHQWWQCWDWALSQNGWKSGIGKCFSSSTLLWPFLEQVFDLVSIWHFFSSSELMKQTGSCSTTSAWQKEEMDLPSS